MPTRYSDLVVAECPFKTAWPRIQEDAEI